MRLLCAPADVGRFDEAGTLRVVLYGQAGVPGRASVGAALRGDVRKERFAPDRRAWDLLSISNSVMVADAAGLRTQSPDG